MASYTNPILHATGDDLAVTDYNAVANNTVWLAQVPYFNYYNSVSTSLPNGVFTQVTLISNLSGYGWSLSSNNAIVPLTGTYSLQWAATAAAGSGSGSDFFQSLIYQNGSIVGAGSQVPSYLLNPASSGAVLLKCTVGDTLGLWAGQNSGSTFNTSTSSYGTYLSGFLVGLQ